MIRKTALAAAMLAIGSSLSLTALAADGGPGGFTPPPLSPANQGKNVFSAQCGLCHSAAANDNGGAQGPSLIGVIGRKAASGNFSYTKAMQDSKLTWDAATLDKFLASPTTVVPGSAMVVAVADAKERANLVAYFQALSDGSYKDPQRPAGGPPGGGFGPAPAAAAPAKGSADWKNDAPGRKHFVDVSNLPPAFDTPSANNFPRVVPKPADASLKVPAGFKVEVYTSELTAPRTMRVAPNGDVFVAETQSGRIKVMKPAADGSKPQAITTFAQGLQQPFGLQFYPATNPQWLYVAENNRIVRYPYKSGDGVASGVPEIVVPKLSNGAGGHYTRDLQFSLDGKRMFVSVGSASNIADQMPKKTLAEAQAWDKEKGAVGATWGNEENRADVLVYDVGNPTAKIFATGIRNCVGLSMQAATGDLWCSTNERDMLGDDLVPDYSTRVKEGGFYGWPWYYMGKYEDPREHVKGQRPDLAGKAIVPDVRYTSHSAAVALAFYNAKTGSSVFPAEYQGQGFAVLHGSWNRAYRTGAKVVRVIMKDNVPTGEYEDFLTGFIISDNSVWGRPNSIVVSADGSLLLGDDGANVVYRISTTK